MTPRTPQLPPHDSLTVIEDQERPKPIGSGMIVCYNRCLYCGRLTPHEVCHLHSRVIGRNRIGSVTPPVEARLNAIPDEERRMSAWGSHFTRAMSAAWRRHFPQPAEVCDDGACPQLAADWQ